MRCNLHLQATPYKKQQWTVLNNFIALLGYYAAAALVDKKWYGRVVMQNVGFIAISIFYWIIYAQVGCAGARLACLRGWRRPPRTPVL